MYGVRSRVKAPRCMCVGKNANNEQRFSLGPVLAYLPLSCVRVCQPAWSTLQRWRGPPPSDWSTLANSDRWGGGAVGRLGSGSSWPVARWRGGERA